MLVWLGAAYLATAVHWLIVNLGPCGMRAGFLIGYVAMTRHRIDTHGAAPPTAGQVRRVRGLAVGIVILAAPIWPIMYVAEIMARRRFGPPRL